MWAEVLQASVSPKANGHHTTQAVEDDAEQLDHEAAEEAAGADGVERDAAGTKRLPAGDFDEGDEVEADYRGKGFYMTAVVTKAESGAGGRVYDLVYEDGRSESKVPGQ
jgi:hypothetical protein